MERQLEVTCDCCNAEHVISVDERGKPTRLNKMEVAYVEVEGVAGIVVVGQLKDGSACDHVGKMLNSPLRCSCCGLEGVVIFSLKALTTSLPNRYFVEGSQVQPSDYVNDRPGNIISYKWGEATADLPSNLLEVDRALALSQGTVRLGGMRSASSPEGPPTPWTRPAGHPVLAQLHNALDKAGVPTHHPLKEGCELPKPMMPQERVEWLISQQKGKDYIKGIDPELGLEQLKELQEKVNTAIYDQENKRG